MKPKTAWLYGGNPENIKVSHAWAAFTQLEGRSEPMVHVVASTGAASYIDREMPRSEAISLYRKMRDEQGWIEVKAPRAGVTVRWLRMMVHD